jgi:hypothetical protein
MREVGALAESAVCAPVTGHKHRAWAMIGAGLMATVLLWLLAR